MRKKTQAKPIPLPVQLPVQPEPPREYGTFDIDTVYENLHSGSAPFYGLRLTGNFIDLYRCDLNPDYQRDHVWTDEQAGKFIGYLIEGGRTSRVIINVGHKENMLYPESAGGKEGKSEVVDGKQRINAALRFQKGEIPAILTNGQRVFISDLDKTSYTIVGNRIGMEYEIVQLSRINALRLYIRLNRGGTAHTDAEINKVRELLNKEPS